MTTHEHTPTVAISDSTVEELIALEFAFLGALLPGDVVDAHADELIAVMLGYHLRGVRQPPERLGLMLMSELSERQILIAHDVQIVNERQWRYRLGEGVARPGYLLDSRGLDVDTLEMIRARAADVAEFEKVAAHIFASPVIEDEHPAIEGILRPYTDQQIIDLVIWSSFAHPLDGEGASHDYPAHVEDEIRRRASARNTQLQT